ncbi:TetR/AcrR family transcriptional regulator [Neoroseomonas alba]|nr:TetR/AcrR family transcriptional regulator [Neoroseomonas alba]
MEAARPRRNEARTRLLDAAVTVLRRQGYAGTTVEDICTEAGVTKGAFFHHFRSKDDLAVAAAGRFSEWLEALFERSGWRGHADPLDRVLAYVDFRIAIFRGAIPQYTCMLGMMVQETYATNPAIRLACEAGIRLHAAPIEEEIAAAMREHGVTGFTAGSLAVHIMAVVQGAFVLAKAVDGPDGAVETLRHLRRYIAMLFREKAP